MIALYVVVIDQKSSDGCLHLSQWYFHVKIICYMLKLFEK